MVGEDVPVGGDDRATARRLAFDFAPLFIAVGDNVDANEAR
jgi:hypothetical protein